MISLVILFFVKHFLADFVLQTQYQWSNKGTFLHPGGLIHSGIHALLTTVILLMYDVCFVELIALDFVSHYMIDYCKVNINRKFNLTTETYGFWVMTGLDQMLHYMAYLTIFYLIMLQLS